MLGQLRAAGYAVADAPERADVVVVNTCSFIQDAKEESIQTILEAADLKRTGRCRALLVSGCLPQRYPQDLPVLLPEVDGFIGTGEFPRIAEIVRAVLQGKPGDRVLGDRAHGLDDGGAAAPAAHARPPRLPQDRRGVRPHLPVLRHPGDPRADAKPATRRRRGRGASTGGGGRPGDRPDLPGHHQLRRRSRRTAGAGGAARGTAEDSVVSLDPAALPVPQPDHPGPHRASRRGTAIVPISGRAPAARGRHRPEGDGARRQLRRACAG